MDKELGRPPKKNRDREYYFFALKIIGDFGASIAVPVVVFVLFGKYLDGRLETTPWLTMVGFALSIAVSGIIIYRKAKIYGQEYQRMNDKND